MFSSTRFGRLGRLLAAGALIGSIVMVASACEEAFGGPQIVSFEIVPDSIPKADSTMDDEYFDVTMQVSGFDAPIDEQEIDLFLVHNDRSVPVDTEFTVDGSTIGARPKKKWVQDLDPGVYTIGASVADENGTSVTDRNLGEVEVTD